MIHAGSVECPRCKKPIGKLINWCPELVPYKAFLRDGTLGFDGDTNLSNEPMVAEQSYTCPECGEDLFTCAGETEAFLKKEG